MDFNLDINGFHIKVIINDIYSYGIVRYRGSKNIKARDFMELWIDHVLLSLYKPERSIFLSVNNTWLLRHVYNGEEIIRELLEIYQEGLRMPVRFFPETSLAYAEKVNTKGHETALSYARDKWINRFGKTQESDDPYYRFCFGESDPLDETFFEFAKTIFKPLLEYTQIGNSNGDI